MSTYQPTLPESASTSYRRARDEPATVAPINPNEAVVHIGTGGHHRVTFDGEDALECTCKGFTFYERCAHVVAYRRALAAGDVDSEQCDPDEQRASNR